MKHEGAFVHVAGVGRVVVYMGADQTGEYIDKFVCAGSWRSMIARGRSPLDEGILYGRGPAAATCRGHPHGPAGVDGRRPRTGTVYCTLTKNTSSAKVVNAPNPRRTACGWTR